MAVVPLSATNIRLLTSVPFNNDYKNSRWFTNKASQTDYFMTKPFVFVDSQRNFQRFNDTYFVSVEKPVDELLNVNYLMFQNAQYNNKWFYAFVTKLEYKNRSNTHVHFELDVLQTWMFDMDFKPSYVLREHRPLWNSDGSPVINTIDEGLNYGTTYETVDVMTYQPNHPFFFLVIVMKERSHSSAGQVQEQKIDPTFIGVPQPLSYYIHPFTQTGLVPNIKSDDNTPLSTTDLMTVLSGFSKMENAVNNVVSIYITENTGLNITYDPQTNTMNFPSGNFAIANMSDNTHMNFSTVYVKKSNSFSRDTINLGDKYDGYADVTESKLLMYPYTTLILQDFRGNQIELKNEYIDSNDLEIYSMGSLGTSNKVTYGVENYLTEKLGSGQKKLLSIETSLINANPNDIPVINDFLSAFLQGNRNSIQNQRNQALFNAITGATGSGVSGVASAMAKTPHPVGVAMAGVNVAKGMGQYHYEIQGINAKLKDIDNTPAQMTKMGSNVAFDYGNGYHGVHIIKKQIHKEYRKILTDYFKMYGYKTNEVKVPNFRTRQNWNYVQTSGCNILGNFNNEDLQELKNVFDNGITLWHTDDVGNYALPNGVR